MVAKKAKVTVSRAKENKGFFIILLLLLILVVSILSMFSKFLALTYMFIGGRATMYMLDIVTILGILNIIFVISLFFNKKWAFFALSGSLIIMTLFTLFSGRLHMVFLYFILLVPFIAYSALKGLFTKKGMFKRTYKTGKIIR